MKYLDRKIIFLSYPHHSAKIHVEEDLKDEFLQDLSTAEFSTKTFYGNMTGADYSADGKEMCVVAHKEDN